MDENILSFRRYLHPMDCFINVLQVFGMLDVLCRNILRISSSRRVTGFTKEEIEGILILITGYNFNFTSDNYVNFENELSTIPLNYGVLVGKDNHVFIISRNSIGKLILIEPQLNYFGPYENYRYLIYSSTGMYYLLLKSSVKLTLEQIKSLGFNV